MTKRQRLDLLLLQRGLAESREQAQQLIRAGWVRQGARVLDKPGTPLPADAPLEVAARPRFVSRGGDKLEAALRAFPLPIRGRVCLDAGLSTGGFTDCLLQHGAERVYGIDVGYGQVAWSLRTDPRVVVRERTNLRHLTPEDLYGPEDPWPDLAVADLSFISLRIVLPALGGLLRPRSPATGMDLVLLVKPQFEVGREGVGKGGVVRDPGAHGAAISGVLRAGEDLGWRGRGLVGSPITGPAGNHEYLLWLSRPSSGARADEDHPAGGSEEAEAAVTAGDRRKGNPEDSGKGNPGDEGEGNPEGEGEGNQEDGGEGNPGDRGKGSPGDRGKGSPGDRGKGNPKDEEKGNPGERTSETRCSLEWDPARIAAVVAATLEG